jgi:hypothetical protein
MLKPQPILLIIYDLINYLERSDENRKIVGTAKLIVF